MPPSLHPPHSGGSHAAPQSVEARLCVGQWKRETKGCSLGEMEGKKQESGSEAGMGL